MACFSRKLSCAAFLLARRGAGTADIPRSAAPCPPRRAFEPTGRDPLWCGSSGGALQHRQVEPRMTSPLTTVPSLTTLGRVLLAFLIATAATLASAQERPRRPPQQQSEQHASEPRQGERDGVLRLLPADSVTEHSVAIPGGTLTYTATAGAVSLFDQSGERSAAVYYTPYVVKNAAPGKRPLTFAFNGGPGAASAYLN